MPSPEEIDAIITKVIKGFVLILAAVVSGMVSVGVAHDRYIMPSVSQRASELDREMLADHLISGHPDQLKREDLEDIKSRLDRIEDILLSQK